MVEGDVVLLCQRLLVMLMAEVYYVVVVEGLIGGLSVETGGVLAGQHVGKEGSHIGL